MALTITHVPDARWVWGESGWASVHTIAPGVSDYVTGGYVIGAGGVAVAGIKNFFGAWIIGANATALGIGSIPEFLVANTSPAKASVTSLNLWMLSTAAAPAVQLANGSNLTGSIWTAIFIGY